MVASHRGQYVPYPPVESVGATTNTQQAKQKDGGGEPSITRPSVAWARVAAAAAAGPRF